MSYYSPANPIGSTIPLHYPELIKVRAQFAEANFSQFLFRCLSRRIGRDCPTGSATLKLIVTTPPTQPSNSGKRILGAWAVRGIVLPSDEQWSAMDREIEDEMVNGPIFPPEHT